MAAFRALESAKPRSERLFADPHARRFLGPGERVLTNAARAPFVRRALEAYADLRAPGARTSGVARTRLIDDWISAECEEGARQVVLLGAGFDARALRLPALSSVRVFELDRAELLALKTRRLGATPANVSRVAIDFLRDDVETRLRDAGFDPALSTVFLWEGVTNYLDQRSVDAVFGLVSRLKARIIFTYVHADAVNGAFEAPGLAALLKRLKRIGEPWTFGFKPDALAGYLLAYGMKRQADLGAAEYRALYRGEAAAHPEGYEFYRVALAAPL